MKSFSKNLSYKVDDAEAGRTHQKQPGEAQYRNVPEWAMSNALLKMVIQEKARRYRFGCRNFRRHTRFVKNRKQVNLAGSYEAFLAGIAYRAWRLGWDSVTIAREQGITPHRVVKYLYRLKAIGRVLAANGWKPVGLQLNRSKWDDPVFVEQMRWNHTPYSAWRKS